MTRRRKQDQKRRNFAIEHLDNRIMLDAAGFVEPVFYGPTPYLSEADTPAGFVPVADCDECVLGLETFEDNTLDFDIILSEGEIIGPGFSTGAEDLTDSVDGDDGIIDGTGQTNDGGYSYFTFGNSITVTLPSLMQSAGLVWTDGAVDITNVIFEAFDQDGNSLGTVEAGDIADDSFMGTTPEDRFFGISFGDGVTTGVTSMRITNIGGSGLEIDHIQFANCSACCDIDLELTKTVDATTVAGGDSITWRIEVTNTGTADATGVQIRDVLPDGVTLVGNFISEGTFDLATNVWGLVDPLSPGEVEFLTLTTLIDSDLPGGTMLVNVAEVIAADQGDVDSTPNNDDGDQSEDDEASAKVTLQGLIDLELSKDVDATTVLGGDSVTWTIEVTNTGTADATGVQIRDVLPDGVTLTGSFISEGTFDPNTTVWSLVDALSPGEVEFLTLTTLVDSGLAEGTMLENVAEVIAADQGDIDSTPGNDDGDQSEDDEASAKVTVTLPQLLTLSGHSYVDTNNDGIFQSIELPLLGVEIQLMGTDTTGNAVNRTTFTNNDGFYQFRDLAAGTYMVKQTQPVQFVDGKDTVGNLGGDDSVNDKFTVTLTDDAVEYNFGELGLRPEYVNKRLYLTSTPYNSWQFIDVRQASIWHSFDITQQSFLNMNAVLSDGHAEFTIFDANMEVVDVQGGDVLGAAPILLAEGEYYLQISGDTVIDSLSLELITPNVTVDGDTVIAVATSGDDDVELQLDSETHVLNISGLIYEFDAGIVDTFHIGASSGNDNVTVHGTELDDRGHAIGTSGHLYSSSYSVNTYSFDNTTFVGGGGYDYTQVYGSVGSDTFAGVPNDAKLITPDNVLHILGFNRVDAYGRGGYDYASLYGTMVDDVFVARDAYTYMSGGGHLSYTKGFERVDGFGRGGNNQAYLFDSIGNDIFVSASNYTYLRTGSRISYAKGFQLVDAKSVNGGSDQAVINGIKTGDTFHAYDDVAQLTGANRDDKAKGFDHVYALAASDDETPTNAILDFSYLLTEDINWI